MGCSILDDFYLNLPNRPYCTDHLESGLKIRQKHAAAQKRYLQFNQPYLSSFLCFDIDDNVLAILDEKLLPEPNLITLNGFNSNTSLHWRGHVIYRLKAPVNTGPNGRKAPMRLLNLVRDGLGKTLGADPASQHLITKNPLHPGFRTITPHDKHWELEELLEWVPSTNLSRDQGQKCEGADFNGRNCWLFYKLRLHAYSVVEFFREHGDQAGFELQILIMAAKLNVSLIPALPYSEVKATSRSVSKWTWDRYHRKGSSKGILTPEEMMLSANDRQALGAKHTNSKRSGETKEIIKTALESLKTRFNAPTQKQVAAETGVSIRTVKRYWYLSEEAGG